MVNAADTVLLANIVAGNLDVADYELETVVVVAPQGGDFTDPVDAAGWVQTQSPGPAHWFVILVTPGEYTVNHSIILIGYTTLQGYGSRASRIIGDLIDAPAVVRIMNADQVAIRVLGATVVDNHMDSSTTVIDIIDSTGCLLEGLGLLADNAGGHNRWLSATNSSGDCRNLEMIHGTHGAFTDEGILLAGSQFNFDHLQVKLTGSESSEIVGLHLTGSMGVILRDCRISVTNSAYGFGATTVKVQSAQSYVGFKDCSLQAVSSSPAGMNNFYFVSDSTAHTIRFYQCQLDGNANPGGADVVRFGCSTSNGVAVP